MVIQTPPDLCSSHVPQGPVQVGIECTCGELYVYAGECSLNSNSNTLESDWPQQYSPTTCDITQQYSSATFLSLRFHFWKKEFSMHFKMLLFYFFFTFFLNCLSLKLHNFKLHKSGNVCTAWRVELSTECRISFQGGRSPFTQVVHEDES
jgi:hypothetical protein